MLSNLSFNNLVKPLFLFILIQPNILTAQTPELILQFCTANTSTPPGENCNEITSSRLFVWENEDLNNYRINVSNSGGLMGTLTWSYDPPPGQNIYNLFVDDDGNSTGVPGLSDSGQPLGSSNLILKNVSLQIEPNMDEEDPPVPLSVSMSRIPGEHTFTVTHTIDDDITKHTISIHVISPSFGVKIGDDQINQSTSGRYSICDQLEATFFANLGVSLEKGDLK